MQLIAFNPALVPLVGDHAAVAVLSQIMYWHNGRLRVLFNGQYWLAKSRADMCQETGITLDQYKRIMPLLVKQGWIKTERHLFKNRVTPFIQLTKRGKGAMSTTTSVVKASNQMASSAPKLKITEITTESTTTSSCVEDNAIAGEKKIKDDGVEQEEKIPMKAQEILKNHTAPMNGSLEGYWKSRMKLTYNLGFQSACTGKERGQLKLLAKSVGDQVKPLIDYAITHWAKFGSHVAPGSWPPNPHIGFLLKHHEVAMNLLAPPPAPSPAMMEASVQLIATGTEKEEVHVLTSKELTEFLDSLKSP